LTLTFSGSQTVKVFKIDYCNFTSITIAGTTYTISRDKSTYRYGLVVVRTITGASISITIPAQSTTDGVTYFSIGRIVLMGSYIEFSANEQTNKSKAPYPEPIRNAFPDGGCEDVITGDLKRWEKIFSFEKNSKTNTNAELWLLDSLKPTDLILYFENEGDSSKGWLCKKKSNLEVEESSEWNDNILNITEHQLIEWV
jgi:hypothetical protein